MRSFGASRGETGAHGSDIGKQIQDFEEASVAHRSDIQKGEFDRLVQAQEAVVRQDLKDLSLELNAIDTPSTTVLSEKTKGVVARLFDRLNIFKKTPGITEDFKAWAQESGSNMRTFALLEMIPLVLGPGFLGSEKTVEVSPAKPGVHSVDTIPVGGMSHESDGKQVVLDGIHHDTMAKGYEVKEFDEGDSALIESSVDAIANGAKIITIAGSASKRGGFKNFDGVSGISVGQQRAEAMQRAIQRAADNHGVSTAGVEWQLVDEGINTLANEQEAQSVRVTIDGVAEAPIAQATVLVRDTAPIPAQTKTLRVTRPYQEPGNVTSFPAEQVTGPLYGELPPKGVDEIKDIKRKKQERRKQKLLTDDRPKRKLLQYEPNGTVDTSTSRRLLTDDRLKSDRGVIIPEVIDEDPVKEEGEIIDTYVIPSKRLKGPKDLPRLPKPGADTQHTEEDEAIDPGKIEEPKKPEPEPIRLPPKPRKVPLLTYEPGEDDPPRPQTASVRRMERQTGPNNVPMRRKRFTSEEMARIEDGASGAVGKDLGKSKIRGRVKLIPEDNTVEQITPDTVNLTYEDYQRLKEQGINLHLGREEGKNTSERDNDLAPDADDTDVYDRSQTGKKIPARGSRQASRSRTARVDDRAFAAVQKLKRNNSENI